MGFWNWLFNSDDEATKRPPAGTQADGAIATIDSCDASPSLDDAQEPPWWAPEGATLREFQTAPRPDLCTEARALESVLISHFDGHDLHMPPLPQVVERVLSKLRDRKCSMSHVADIIAEDQVVAAGVLRIANSPLYRGLNRITALRPAVSRLGTRALQTLMMHESVRSTMFRDVGTYREFANLLWQCSLTGACVMREISQFTSVEPEEAFLIGLLHDIGNVIVLRIAHGHKKISHYELDIDTFDYLCSESHQEFGELVADAWKLPENLKDLIADHHAYPTEDDSQRVYRLMLQLTDMCCSLLGYAPMQPYDLVNSRPAQELNVHDRPDFMKMLENLPAVIEEVVGGS